MAKTVILSDETVRGLIEAHASMAAWYYAMSAALQKANASVEPPSDEQRHAFVSAMAQHFPELSAIIQTVDAPRPYIPPPVVAAPAQVVENVGVNTPDPPADHMATPDRVPGHEPPAVVQPPQAVQTPGTDAPKQSEPPAPPAIVDPNKVKYE